MTTIRRFCCNDLLRFTPANLDHFTETFNMSVYMKHFITWPEYFLVAEGPGNQIMGYIMGKIVGKGKKSQAEVTTVSVAPEYRRQQVATKLMNLFEEKSENNTARRRTAFYGDLFLSVHNTPAVKMCEKLGYTEHRREQRFIDGAWRDDRLHMRKTLREAPPQVPGEYVTYGNESDDDD